jgi:hypothetical protein
MSPITHLMASWIVAAKTTDNLRDRRLVTLAGVAPDLDGLSILLDYARGAWTSGKYYYYPYYHHYVTHGLLAAVICSGLMAALAQRRWRVFWLAFLTFHLHLLCDLVGSRGPDKGDIWPILYFGPLSQHPMWMWKYQWRLDGWQNQVIFVALFAWSLCIAVKKGDSFVGVFNQRCDRVFVGVLQKWRERLGPLVLSWLSKDSTVLISMAAVLTLPFILTLMTIVQPRPKIEDFRPEPTPYGYTWSLSLFIVPVVVIACWLWRRWESRVQNRAFWITTLIVAGSGIMLDVFFGLSFFTFPNRGAVLGACFYGYSFTEGWKQTIPIEEIGFYVFGIMAVLLVYVWGDEFWFRAYNADDAPRRSVRRRDLLSFHPASAWFGIVVFILGLLYKKFGHHSAHEGFPGYFLFLTLVALTPSVLFFPVASPFINWRAFSLGFLFILLVSLFWEGAIAVPYQWWDFNHNQMLGMFINGFSGLPVEEPLLWLGVTWATVIIYEVVSTLLVMDGSSPVAE